MGDLEPIEPYKLVTRLDDVRLAARLYDETTTLEAPPDEAETGLDRAELRRDNDVVLDPEQRELANKRERRTVICSDPEHYAAIAS